MDVNAVLGDAALVVCVGPGGVGKTSVSASLGIAAARAGRRVCVLTVDPARRLAAALGVGLGDHPSRVPITASGELWAAMLDAPASLAAMIDRVAPDPEFKRRMLADPMYRAGAGALSRSHAYAAMEWLHDVFERDAFDLVVLDTPPAAVGVEMFDAPGRLLALLDPKVFGWLLEPRKPGLAGRVLAGGGALVRRGAEAVMGEGPWSSLVDFLALLDAAPEARGILVITSTPSGATVEIDGEVIGPTPARVELPSGIHDVVVRKADRVTQTRRVELGPDGGDVTARFELPRDPQLDARAGKIAGWSLIGVGVAAMATGIGLVVLDENPVKNDCSGVHVDRFGNCEFRWNTMGAGVGLLVPGVLAAAAGTTLVVLDARRRRDPDRARARVGVGVARVDLTLRF